MAICFRAIKQAITGLFQTKTVTASTSALTVTPDSGYDGLSEVIVNPQAHSEYYPSSSNYYYLSAGSTATIDLGTKHNYRKIRMYRYSGSTYYRTISGRGGFDYWKFNDSGYNSRTVTISVSGLSTERANYILLVYGRNYTVCADVSVSVSTGSLSLVKSDYDTYDGNSGNDCYTAFKLYRWTAYSSSGSITVDRSYNSGNNIAGIYNISVFN